MYQDIWLNGMLVKSGKRNCDDRYKIIRQFVLKNLHIELSVLDVGSNMAYFPIRLIEDFRANVLAFEFHQYRKRNEIIKAQRTNKLSYINRKVSLSDLLLWRKFMKFDLCLALSVLHHNCDSENISQWIDAINKLSKYSIFELAGTDSDRTKYTISDVPDGYKILGYSDSHLKNYERIIISYTNY